MRIVAMLGCLLCTAALADALTLHQYLDMTQSSAKEDHALLTAYLVGLGEGFSWAEIHLRQIHGRRLYCPPDGLVLTEKDYRAMLESQIHDAKHARFLQEWYEREIIGMLLLAGLIETFPCETP
jgi:hypothetical protein